MRIKVIANSPVDIQDGIEDLIGKEFETVPYREFDLEVREEMKVLGEVGIRIGTDLYILNKEEYQVLSK